VDVWPSAIGWCSLVVLGLLAYVVWRVECVAASFKAKLLCSGLFVSQRDRRRILSEDLDSRRFPVLRTVAIDVDVVRQSVTARGFGFVRRTAIFRSGLGSTLLVDQSADTLRSTAVPVPSTRAGPGGVWPEGEDVTGDVPASIDAQALNGLLDKAFEDPDPRCSLRTRAVVVVHDGRIIAERYAPGFTHAMPLPGWSMSKSVLSALVGIAVSQARLRLEDRQLLPEWASPDPRSEITVDHLLRMRSGLAFSETYTNPFSGVLRMLFDTGSASRYAARSRLREAPDTRWYYSSGTTNILSRVLRNAVGDDAAYLSFPRTALFDRIGMSTAVMEPDVSGTFVGSSFMYASARDWARFGLLYALDGVWNEQRVLPKGWVEYSRTPTPGDSHQLYGAHFWLGLPLARQRIYPERPLPRDLFHAPGYEGQYLVIIPSRKLVIVRLGLTADMDAWDQRGLVTGILDAVGDPAKPTEVSERI